MYRLNKILISLFFILCSAFIFAELPKVPNILITDNPSKEVTTVNALKNRDHAELNITVNKVNIKKLNGIELPNGEVLITLPETQDAKIALKENEIFYITDSLDNFPDLTTINGKREIYNLKKLKESITSDKVDIVKYEDYSLIKNIKKNIELYLGIIDKSNGNINKIWKIDKNKDYKTQEIKGYIENDNLVINLSNLDNLKTNILQKKVIFFGTNNEKKGGLQPRSGRKRSLSEKEKVEITYIVSDNLKINLNSNTLNNIMAFDKASNKLYTFRRSWKETIDLRNSFVGEVLPSKIFGTDVWFEDNLTLNDRLISDITQDNPLTITDGVVLFYNSLDELIYLKKLDKVSNGGSKKIIFKRNGVEEYDITFNILNTYREPVESNITLNSPVYHKFAIDNNNILTISGDRIGREDYAIGKADGTFMQIDKSNITNRLKFFGNTPESLPDDKVTLDSNWVGRTYSNGTLKVRMTFNKDNKAHFEILSWDGRKAQTLKIGYESVFQKQTINLTLPAFNGLSYLDLENTDNPEVNYKTKTVTKYLDNYDKGILGSFNINIDNYSIKALQTSTTTRFNVQLPRSIELKLPDSTKIPVSLSIPTNATNKGIIIRRVKNFFNLYTSNQTSIMNFRVELKVSSSAMNKIRNLKSSNPESLQLIGTGLKLVEVGTDIGDGIATSKLYDTAIDNIEINIKKTTYTESFDVSSLDNQKTVVGTHIIPISDSSILEIYEVGQQQNTLLKKISMEDFKKSGYELNETASLLKYDITTSKFQLTKLKEKDISKNYQIKVNSFGIASKIINITVKNGTFGIIEGKNILNFGDFFPGDVKIAETYIKFKNFTGKNISIKMKKDTGEMTLNGNTTTDPNEKIKLSEFRVSDLDTQNPQENKFKIKGVATTTNNTKVGKYKGRAEVIITIIP